MRLSEHFKAGHPVISFEVFPPKTGNAQDQLNAALPDLVALQPSYMTVTYGAFGSTRERTPDIAAGIQSTYEIDTASHLTCVGATREEIDELLDRLEKSGIENIVALRGDPPQGQASFVPPAGGFSHANELVAHIRARGKFGIAVAGYPEKHLEAPDLETDLRHLKNKVDAGADVVVTQLFYDNDHFFHFEREARKLGIEVPIVAGLLPIQSAKQVLRLSSMCGATVPESLQSQLEAAGEDSEAVRDVGVRWAVAQCRELLEKGVAGIHFYVLNRARPVEKIFEALESSGHLKKTERTQQ